MKKYVLAALAVVSAIGALVYVLERPPEGLEPIVWDHSSCSHCHMHVGDPHYAAQLQTIDGEVHNFDDPGCLFEWRAEHRPAVSQTYFHHHRQQRWLSGDEVGFVEVDQETPMGYGLGAVEAGRQPEAMSLEQAAEVVLRRGACQQGDGCEDEPSTRQPREVQ